MDNLFDLTDPVLRVPVPVTQEKTEFSNLARIVRDLKPTKIIEIGTFFGGSLYCWTQIAPEAQIAAIDDLDSMRHVQFPVHGFMERVNASDLANLWCGWSNGVTPFFGKSVDVFDDVKAQFDQCDFIFIDGDHSYEGAKRDFELYKPLVRPGGLIALHDIINYSGVPENNVEPLWEEIKATHPVTIELLSRKNQEWMGIGVVVV